MGGHYVRQPLLERILVDMDEVLDIRDNLGADAVRGLAVLLPRSTVYTPARACVRHVMAIGKKVEKVEYTVSFFAVSI
jgi:hypothetical protein